MKSNIPVLLAVLLLAATATPLDTNAQNRTVSVQGEGIVHVTPDFAVVRFAVVTHNDDAERAFDANEAAAARAMNAVRGLGIEERFIKLETLQLQPRREYNQQTRNWEERGFEATRQVSVEIDDMEKLPALVSTVVSQGANRLGGITYDVRDREGARQEALRLAAANAREKAVLLTEALGAGLSFVMQITESGVYFPTPQPVMLQEAAMRADSGGNPAAYAAGELEVRANVSVTFAIE
ncbi:MAG: SIMPL domain-containing protein [Rhodothermales bacterium]|nr:SIMPL domain-containing protein [Rhodothermales bacterium]MBO6780160.1 SIMPL domain-containing protein [Rhodothermales bacterium]